MKVIGIPHHYSSPNYFWDELCGSVAIFTNPQIFPYSERSTRSCVDEPKGNSQFLIMVTQRKYLFFFFHIIQHKFCTRYIPCASCINPDNLCSFAWISIISGWSWLSATNICTSSFTSIQVQPSCFFTPFSFLCRSTFSQRCLLPVAAYMFDNTTYPAALSGYISRIRLAIGSAISIYHEFCKHQAKPSM